MTWATGVGEVELHDLGAGALARVAHDAGHLDLAVRRSVLRTGDRVLFVDEWAATGGQALACRQLVDDADAHWLGAAVVVDALESSADRRTLNLRGLLHVRELNRR